MSTTKDSMRWWHVLKHCEQIEGNRVFRDMNEKTTYYITIYQQIIEGIITQS
jgi:hypothetical protein